MTKFSRRDFLKLSALIPAGAALSPLVSSYLPSTNTAQDLPANVIIILFDAMTARNLSVYGYQRATTPNFIRFAQRAIVYHSHYSAGNFTVPGTTSLLTGLYPWTHRAINQAGLMRREFTGQNIFKAMNGKYKRLASARTSGQILFSINFRTTSISAFPRRPFPLRMQSQAAGSRMMCRRVIAPSMIFFSSSVPRPPRLSSERWHG